MTRQVSSTPLRIGILGAGQIVEDEHLPTLASQPNARVLWVADMNPTKAARVGGMYRIPAIDSQVFGTALRDIDVALIAVPYGARAEYLQQCSAARASIYVEKPLARTVQEHDAICALFKPHQLAVGLQRRFYGNVQLLRSLLQDEIAGPVRSIDIEMGGYSLKGGGRYHTSAALAGGGILMEIGVHFLDSIAFAVDAHSVETVDVQSVSRNGIDVQVQFASRLITSTASIPVSGTISRIRNLANQTLLHTDSGTIRLGPAPDDPLLIRTSTTGTVYSLGLHRAGSSPSGAGTVAGAFFQCWADFLDGVTNERPALTSGGATRLVSCWISQLYDRMADD